jgi:hypothetical protein
VHRETSAIPSAREQAIQACRALLNGSGKLGYFEQRGITAEILKRAGVGYEAGTFTYPCIRKSGGLLAIHCKSETRDAKGKRQQWWKGYADDLPSKGHGRRPDDPAKVIPFGLETLRDLKPGSPVILCCGEEDALSLRQSGYTALSQPGAGLLEPVYARELAGFEVVAFYDAGEEKDARKDALKLCEAGAKSVRVVEWPPEASYGTDVNGTLVADPEGFATWAAEMIAAARSVTVLALHSSSRDGEPDAYSSYVLEPAPWPVLSEEALHGLPGKIVNVVQPHTEADPVAILTNVLAAFGNAIGRGA